jgi:hypothetical protein
MNLKLRSTVAIVAASLSGVASAGVASADTLYGISFPGVTPIFTVNQTSGALTTGPSTDKSNVGDLASGKDGSIWGIGISGPGGILYQFNPLTGSAVSTVSITGTSSPIVSLAYDNSANLVYGTTAASFDGVGNLLYRINPVSGAATLVGDFGIPSLYGLAFNQKDGFLYGTNGEFSDTSSLYRINTATASATLIGSTGVNGVFDIAFRPSDNALFMSSSGAFSLYMGDITTAATTLVGTYGSSTNIAGLAFVETSVVPVPSSVALMLTGLAGLGWAARRRRA